MKAWAAAWGIMAVLSLIAVFCGESHHFYSFAICAGMFWIIKAELDEETDENEENEENEEEHGN